MIKTLLVTTDGQVEKGDERLLNRWRNEPDTHIWIDISGGDTEADRTFLIESMNYHPLAVQDALRERHPPKLELFDDYVFLLLRGLDADSSSRQFGTVPLSFFIGNRCLVSRSSGKSKSIDSCWQDPDTPNLLRRGTIELISRIGRAVSARYLTLLMDFEPKLTAVEDSDLARQDDKIIGKLTGYKTRLRKLRRINNYHERVFAEFGVLFRTHKERFDECTAHLLTDLFEKFERLSSLSNLYYELAGDLIEGYLSLSSHMLNRTMQVLTVMMSIFVPLSFLAGIYGMNFENMPELHSRWGYFILLGVMALISTTLMVLFKRKRWL